MRILLVATAICYALATFFRVREKVTALPLKNHSRFSFVVGILVNTALFFKIAKDAAMSSTFELNSLLITGSLSLALCAIAIELIFNENYFSVFTLPICFIMLLLTVPVSGSVHGDQFSKPWFTLHLITSIVGESFFMIAAISSTTYLFVVRKLKRKNKLKALYLFPPLARLNDLTGKFLATGILTFAAGLAIGIHGSYQQFSSFEPAAKHWFAGMVLLYYIVLLALKNRLVGPKLAVATILGFVLSIGLVLIPDNEPHWLHTKARNVSEATK